jgi:hypothetical protein
VAAQDRLLTLQDVSADLGRLIGGTELDFVAKAKIGYGVTGRGEYDQFFRESAIAYGGRPWAGASATPRSNSRATPAASTS